MVACGVVVVLLYGLGLSSHLVELREKVFGYQIELFPTFVEDYIGWPIKTVFVRTVYTVLSPRIISRVYPHVRG